MKESLQELNKPVYLHCDSVVKQSMTKQGECFIRTLVAKPIYVKRVFVTLGSVSPALQSGRG